MNIELIRHAYTRHAIDGEIYIHNHPVCSCTENLNTPLQCGTYAIHIHKCKQYGRNMPLLIPLGNTTKGHQMPKCRHCPKRWFVGNNTLMPSYCPMLKSGNGVQNRNDGSIIVGSYLCSGAMIHTDEVFLELFQRIRKSTARGKKIIITIRRTV